MTPAQPNAGMDVGPDFAAATDTREQPTRDRVLAGAEAKRRLRAAVARAAASAGTLASWQPHRLLRVFSGRVRHTTRPRATSASTANTRLLTMMSHELRTPLNAIGGYAQLMQLGLRGPVTAQQFDDLGRIQLAQAKLLGIVNSVLNHAKLDVGVVRYELGDVTVRDVVAEVFVIVEHLASAKRLTCMNDADDGAPGALALVVRSDPEKFRQVLLNLLTNAVKFTPPGGCITIRSDADGMDSGAPVVRVCVTDTGAGIAADQLEHVFDPFVQVDRQLNSTHEGVGLGLSISRELARAMSGDLVATSALGGGATFTLSLPQVMTADLGERRTHERRGSGAPVPATDSR